MMEDSSEEFPMDERADSQAVEVKITVQQSTPSKVVDQSVEEKNVTEEVPATSVIEDDGEQLASEKTVENEATAEDDGSQMTSEEVVESSTPQQESPAVINDSTPQQESPAVINEDVVQSEKAEAVDQQEAEEKDEAPPETTSEEVKVEIEIPPETTSEEVKVEIEIASPDEASPEATSEEVQVETVSSRDDPPAVISDDALQLIPDETEVKDQVKERRVSFAEAPPLVYEERMLEEDNESSASSDAAEFRHPPVDSPALETSESSSADPDIGKNTANPPALEPAFSVIDEMMEGMALAFLIFLIADMRLMSATGRVMTKFENISVESDYVVKDSAAICAGTFETLPFDRTNAALDNKGLSPAQMMAVVLIELKKTINATNEETLSSFSVSRRSAIEGKQSTSTSIFGPGSKKGTKIDQDNMHALLKAYAQMIGNDLAEAPPHIEKRKSMLHLMNASTEPENRRANVRGSMMEMVKNLNFGAEAMAAASEIRKGFKPSMSIRNVTLSENTKTVNQLKETTDTLFQMGMAEKNRDLRASLAGGASANFLSADEVLTLMEKAVQSRVHGKLDFMSRFFRDGTLSQLMINSKIKIVWVNDWYPVKVSS
jgi:hypothetical protein